MAARGRSASSPAVPARTAARVSPSTTKFLDRVTPEQHRRDFDPVSGWVSATVQRSVTTGAHRPDKPARPPQVRSVAGVPLTALVTLVRVETDAGPREFLVKMSEVRNPGPPWEGNGNA